MSDRWKRRGKRVLAELLHKTSSLSPKSVSLTGGLPWKILTYHRVIDPNKSPFPLQPGMYVLPETFAEQMEYLSKNANVVSLATLTSMLESDAANVPEKTVVLTFDDGWADNYEFAFPILTAHNLPATVFLATSFINTSRLFWTDSVAHCLRELTTLQNRHSAIEARMYENDNINLTTTKTLLGYIIEACSTEEQGDKIDSIIEFLKERKADERRIVVGQLEEFLAEYGARPPERQFMNWEEIAEMSKAGVSFGSHSHQHLRLTELSSAQISDELTHSHQMLKQHDIEPSNVFCYPGGYYSEATQHALAENDIPWALTTERRTNLDFRPQLLGRVGIHQDVSDTSAMFSSRIWGGALF